MPAMPHEKSQPFCHFGGCFNYRRANRYCQGHTKQLRAGEPLRDLPRQRREPWDVPRCSFDGCDDFYSRRGLCDAHYVQYRTGRPLAPKRLHSWQKGGICAFDGCRLPMRTGDLCATHASQKRQGKDLHEIRGRISCPLDGCERTYTVKSSVEFCAHHTRVLREYTITPAELHALYTNGATCAICGDSGLMHVDHDHACCPESGRSCGRCVRGLLCFRCNRALGFMRDSPAALRAAADYLERRVA